MADHLEPLLAEAEGYGGSGYDFSVIDEELLAELRSMEAGTVGQPEHVEDADVYKMRELIREKPKDVIQVCCGADTAHGCTQYMEGSTCQSQQHMMRRTCTAWACMHGH
jgi:hypothetical protein